MLDRFLSVLAELVRPTMAAAAAAPQITDAVEKQDRATILALLEQNAEANAAQPASGIET
jgi:hypothetical protein